MNMIDKIELFSSDVGEYNLNSSRFYYGLNKLYMKRSLVNKWYTKD